MDGEAHTVGLVARRLITAGRVVAIGTVKELTFALRRASTARIPLNRARRGEETVDGIADAEKGTQHENYKKDDFHVCSLLQTTDIKLERYLLEVGSTLLAASLACESKLAGTCT